MLTLQENMLKLNNLVNTIDQFVNGPSSSTITVDSGVIKTLAGLSKQALQTRYMQKVVPYTLKATAVADALAGVILFPGNVAQVFGESNPAVNGLYLVQEDLSIRRIDYQDIYDLHQNLPSPWEYVAKIFTPTEIASQTASVIRSFRIQNGSLPYHQSIEVAYEVKSSVTGKVGIRTGSFMLLIIKNIDDLLQQVVYDDNVATLKVDVAFGSSIPTIEASMDNDGDGFSTITLRAVHNEFLPGDLAQVKFTLKGINPPASY